MLIFEELESNVQSYGRSFPSQFRSAYGSYLTDVNNNKFLDFLSGAGTLNYGHNPTPLRNALLRYIENNGITHSLDMYTEAKANFLTAFNESILIPRKLEYKTQFTGPTGANAVEAALKLARKNTGRESIVAFTNGFHGVTLGALAATGNQHHRAGAGVSLSNITRIPYDNYISGLNSAGLLEKLLSDNSSGVDLPAAVILETVQGEGGLNTASDAWLREIEALCRKFSILLIVDDIQTGCGRTGTFFSFESSGIKPDIITLSKSLSGYGLPFALTLIKPELDCWKPGEHNGTFRGNNLAFVTATEAIKHYWQDPQFQVAVQNNSKILQSGLHKIANANGQHSITVKGRGMMCGLEFESGELTSEITRLAFNEGMLIESSGPDGEVLKCLCPLTITEEEIENGLMIIERCVEQVLKDKNGVAC